VPSRSDPSQGRLRRLSSEPGIARGLLRVAEATALASVGFRPVSEVIGAVANSVSPRGFYAPAPPISSPYGQPGGQGVNDAVYRGGVGNQFLTMPTYTSSTAPVSVGIPPLITALKAGYRTALSRMIAEAKAVDADGVLGVQVTRTVSPYGGSQLWSFLAIGTAVRSIGATHTGDPFTTDLSGAQVAAGMATVVVAHRAVYGYQVGRLTFSVSASQASFER
jgi:hypothetical protein